MTEHVDLYANPPLALVAMEVRFPSEASGLALGPAVQREFRDHLGDHDWVIESNVHKEIEVAFQEGGPTSQRVRTSQAPRFTTRDRTTAVTTAAQSLTVETTVYHGFDGFRELLDTVFLAIGELSPPDGVSRVGLRYIDEIRVGPDRMSVMDDWAGWIHPQLMAPPKPESDSSESTVLMWSGTAQYGFSDDRYLVFRYGPGDGYAIGPSGPLRRPLIPSPGPFFRLDFDSYWEPQDLPPFDPQELVRVCDALHEPTSLMFEGTITDQLRNEIFRRRQLE